MVIDLSDSTLPAPFHPIHWLSRNAWIKKKKWDRCLEQSVYGESRIWLCLGAEEQHLPLRQPRQTPALPLQPSPSLRSLLCVGVTSVFWPVCVCVCVWVDGSNGSGTSEDLFWKLDALQTFIRDLHWPEEEFAKHLESRIKLMSSNMIENCVKRYVVHECMRKRPISRDKNKSLSWQFSAFNVSLALQHQDGIWVQADKEQQVHRFPHFSDVMHHVQRDGGCQGPIS